MADFVHIGEGNRIDGRKAELYEEAELELGWMEWPFEGPVPERCWEYAIVDGELVHVGEEPVSGEGLRAAEVREAHDDLPEIQEGLMEVARMAADNETTLEDIEEAIVELAALIGGE